MRPTAHHGGYGRPGPASLEASTRAHAILRELGSRPIVLTGMMGAGKTSSGRRLAAHLGLDFVDSDHEIEAAAGMTIPEIFARDGEPYFRDRENRVVARLIAGGPRVVATGGGAFIHPATRLAIKSGSYSVWIKADFDVLMRRVRRRSNRPLLQTPDPEGTLKRLMAERYPIYAEADLTVVSHDVSHEAMVAEMTAGARRRAAARRDRRGTGRCPRRRRGPAGAVMPGPDGRSPERVAVALGPRAYDILIGPDLLAEAGPRIAALAPGAACAVVTDAHVAERHLDPLLASLAAAGLRAVPVLIAPGEGSKSFATYAEVCGRALDAKLERGDVVVALGGGVVGDLAGFVSATLKRGTRFVQVPTTLLAQVDSSVGGKTGINAPQGKNLVGAFHQPLLVLADTGCLDTLPGREFRAGYAEVVKYGLIDDAPFFRWLDENRGAILAGGVSGTAARRHAIAHACRAKAAVVERDEHETGDRALLNLGHTFGHALERLTRYDGARLVHGEGVAIGSVLAFRFSVALGLCPAEDATRVEAHLAGAGLPTRIRDVPDFDADAPAILEAMFQDKKVTRGRLNLILARGIGQSFIARDQDAGAVRRFLADELTRD